MAYSKCLQAGILCAWRRQPPSSTTTNNPLLIPDYRIDVVKELWVFWYSQEEPELLSQFTSHLSCKFFIYFSLIVSRFFLILDWFLFSFIVYKLNF